MKRLNPKTNEPFKRGDIREDGYVFFGYGLNVLRKTGYWKEIWLSPEKIEASRKSDAARKRAEYKRLTDRKPAGYRTWPLEKRAMYDQYIYQKSKEQ